MRYIITIFVAMILVILVQMGMIFAYNVMNTDIVSTAEKAVDTAKQSTELLETCVEGYTELKNAISAATTTPEK